MAARRLFTLSGKKEKIKLMQIYPLAATEHSKWLYENNALQRQ